MLEDHDHLSFKEFNHNYDMQEDDQMEEESRLVGGQPLWTAHELNYDIFEFWVGPTFITVRIAGFG